MAEVGVEQACGQNVRARTEHEDHARVGSNVSIALARTKISFSCSYTKACGKRTLAP
jgi:hypothetical protein